MGNRIHMVGGMPVEVQELDGMGELERERLNELAEMEYENSGTLSSKKLLEANESFLEKAKVHVIDNDEY